MKSRVEHILSVTMLFAALALLGCNEDTTIGVVQGGQSNQPDGSTPACPAGPGTPLGLTCSTPDQLCKYGYDIPNCGGRTVICKSGRWIEESHTDPGTACFDAGSHDTSQSEVEPASDGNQAVCCPRDSTMSGCMHLGGTKTDQSSCGETCDFWCSTNWRVLVNAQGCEYWAYDHRAPAADENPHCIVAPDAGKDGAAATDTL